MKKYDDENEESALKVFIGGVLLGAMVFGISWYALVQYVKLHP